MKALLAAALLLLASSALANIGSVHTSPESAARQSKNGFSGLLLVTPDADYKAKWDTPSETTPRFDTIDSVPRGKHIYILAFFANPGLDSDGRADITCDIDVIPPDASKASHHPGLPCFKGAIHEDPAHVFLSNAAIAFVGDPGDPAGVWNIHITLHDNVRHITLPLRTHFTLRDTSAPAKP